MQLQRVAYNNPYSLNNRSKTGFSNPAFGLVKVSCTENTQKFLGADKANSVLQYANEWFRDFPAKYVGVLNSFVDVVKNLELNVFRKAEETVVLLEDSEIPQGRVVGQSKEKDVLFATEDALHTVLDNWARARFELQKKPTKFLN